MNRTHEARGSNPLGSTNPLAVRGVQALSINAERQPSIIKSRPAKIKQHGHHAPMIVCCRLQAKFRKDRPDM